MLSVLDATSSKMIIIIIIIIINAFSLINVNLKSDMQYSERWTGWRSVPVPLLICVNIYQQTRYTSASTRNVV